MVFGELGGDIEIAYKSGKFMPSEAEFESSGWALSWETELHRNRNAAGYVRW